MPLQDQCAGDKSLKRADGFHVPGLGLVAWGQSNDGRDGFWIGDTENFCNARVLLIDVAVAADRRLDGVCEVGLEVGNGQSLGGGVRVIHVCDDQDV